MTADEENVKHIEVMMNDRHSRTVEILPLEQAILEILEITEIEESMMIEDNTNVRLWETLPKLNMEHVT